MTDFLSVNGAPFPVSQGSFNLDLEMVGEGIVRTANAAARKNYRALKQHLTAKSTPLAQDEAVAWVQLLAGEGDSLRFLTATGALRFFTDKGLDASDNSGTLNVYNTSGRYHGEVEVTAGAYVVWNSMGSTLGLTILVAHYNGATWDDWAMVLNGSGTLTAVYKNGAAQSVAFPSWAAQDHTGSLGVELQAQDGVSEQISELQMFPFAMPTSWLPSIATWRAANAIPVAPELVVSGDFHPVALTCQGKPGASRGLAGVLSPASFSAGLREVSLDLQEV